MVSGKACGFTTALGLLDLHLDRLFEAAKAIDLDIGLDRQGVKNALLNAISQSNAIGCACAVDGHARGETPPLSTSVFVALGADFCEYYGAFAAKIGAPRAPCHGAPSTRLADDAGSKIKLAF